MQHSKRILSLVLIAIGSQFFGACGEEEKQAADAGAAAPASEPVSSWPATRSTDGGSFEVTLKPSKGGIVQNKHFTLDVSIQAKEGEVKDVTVVVDGDMPAHGHGMNTKPEVTATGDSEYRVEGMLFHMGGDWVITADVKRDGKTERALFPITIE